ncbi:hypothetical protein EPO34_03730 [Patescibacteria group bacterium]|nr:MAG: hypothetical protein EPO34_03730 [Patescibacteria group bacterium]
MKILVIEDKEIHQNSARETLQGHDVTIVGSYDEAVKAIREPYPSKPLEFDAVLTDMNLPMSKETLTPDVFKADEQVPYGLVLALMAAHRGAKFVAMVTDTNHHKGAMSAALDCLGPSYYTDEYSEGMIKRFEINGCKAVFVHAPFLTDSYPDSGCPCEDGLCSICRGTLMSYGKPCRCTEDDQNQAGKCYSCHGTLKYTREVKERKDWGKVLSYLKG